MLPCHITTINVLSKYDNVLAYNISNEMLTNSATNVVPFLKAAARDIKAYLSISILPPFPSLPFSSLALALTNTPTPTANQYPPPPSSATPTSTALLHSATLLPTTPAIPATGRARLIFSD
ncbi:hypothetical protein B0H19DRAFT_1250593 [Mycena capillaripes]|nr:hypothetical protein B0H19DRAFT_1250593 [Mycena capillaripes]